MSNYVILNSSAHANTKVITDRGAEYGDNIKYALTFAFEFRNIQSCYPIFFSKDSETGQFHPIALFGLANNENLFLDDRGWDATYIPMMIERHPFLIGYQGAADPDGDPSPVVSIDMDNPRVSKLKGETLFTDGGKPTAYLEQAVTRLEAIHRGHEHNKDFVTALLDNDLLEPFTMEIKLNDGSDNQLLGFYTINEDKLSQLSGEALSALNTDGHLQPIYMALASYARVRTLIDKKNAQQT